MCFLALLHKTVKDYPLVLAANRDESRDRPGLAPLLLAPGVWGPKDPRAGGTWLGVNRHGLLAAIANLTCDGPCRPNARSRGLLCVDLLSADSVTTAIDRLAHLMGQATYSPFNLLLADGQEACFATHRSRGASARPSDVVAAGYAASMANTGFEPTGAATDGLIAAGTAAFCADRLLVRRLEPGLHVLGNLLPDDPDDRKVARGRSLVGAATTLDQAMASLQTACRDHGQTPDAGDAICIHGQWVGTLSSSIVALGADRQRSRYLFCDGNPCQSPYQDLSEVMKQALWPAD